MSCRAAPAAYNIHVGTQRGRDPDRAVSADAAEAVLEIPVETVTAPDAVRPPRIARRLPGTDG